MPKHSPFCGEIPTPLPPKATIGASLVAAVVAHDPEADGTLIFLTSVTGQSCEEFHPVVEIELYMNLKNIFAALEPCHGPRNQWSFTKSGDFLIGGRFAILPTKIWCEPSELQCPSRERPSKGVFTRILVGPPKKMAGTPVSFKKFWVITHIYNPAYMWIHMTYDSYDTYYTLW